jgi:hypothetical protein
MKHLAVRLSLFLCLLYVVPLFAQTADVSGTVTDQSGAVVANASVRIINQSTLVERDLQTNGQGVFSAPFIEPGLYRIFVEAQGFSTEAINNVKIDVAAQINLPIHLRVGSQQQTVKVDGSGISINTTDASVGTTIDRKFVENMPLNGRSFQDLISMTPGVTTQSPQLGGGSTGSIGAIGDFSVNGQRTESNSYTVDGVSANVGAGNGYGVSGAGSSGSVASSTALGTTQSMVSVDDLQEFRVLSSTYSAEYGRGPGGQFTFLTRSGTNQLHGSAFDYLRNGYFDSNDWFNDHYGQSQPALRQNDFGGTVGGPIIIPGLYNGREKSFFFVSYEGLRLTQPEAASVELVPDLYLRQQAPAAVQPTLNVFPLPSAGGIDYGSASNPSLAQFIEAYSVPAAIDSTSARLDHTFGSKLSIFFRAAYSPSSSDTRSLSSLNQTKFSTQTYTFGATSQLARNMTNEFRLGFTKSDSGILPSLDNFGGATPINLAAAVGAGQSKSAQGYMYLDFPGAGTSQLSTGITSNRLRQWNIVDTVNYTIGRHSLKFGADHRRIDSGMSNSYPSVLALFYGASNVLNNAPLETEVEAGTSAAPIFQEFAAFAQDEWRVRPTLVLSLGLRWEVDPPPTGANGQDAYTITGAYTVPASLGIAPRGTPLWQTSWYNFAPRLGVAWTAHANPGWETVVRSGAGVFFDTDNQVASDGFIGVGFFSDASYSGVPIPLTPAQTDLSVAVSPPYGTLYVLPKHLQLPYTLEWNTSLEQALGKAQSLTLSYVGSNGRRQLRESGYSLSAYNPEFTYLYYFYGGISSNYNSLQAKFQRSLSPGVQALASYTWGHAIDYGSTYQVQYVLRGNADFDVRNSFSGGLSWDLPHFNGDAITDTIFNGWGVDGRITARSGFPVSLMGNDEIDSGNGSLYYTGLDLVANEPLYLYGGQYPGGRAINPSAFAAPSGTAFGNAPRNFVRGFGENQLNLAARRDFHLVDNLTLQFRAESFNLLNHPNFGYIDPYITDATFGQATKMLNQSLGTMASQYQQGGPRAMQFALKATF